MKFEINGRKYKILEKNKEEMFGVCKDVNKENGREYLGLHFPAKNEIWLLSTLEKGQKKKTLMHELMHCYIWCYISDFESLNEEDICDISANSHEIIHKIVEQYFKKVKE